MAGITTHEADGMGGRSRLRWNLDKAAPGRPDIVKAAQRTVVKNAKSKKDAVELLKMLGLMSE